MVAGALPRSAAWRHHTARDGTECAFFHEGGLSGWTAALEAGQRWVVGYDIEFDADTWRTRKAVVRCRSDDGDADVTLEADGNGRWTVDGIERPELDGCLDVDLESSVTTNLLSLRRLDLAVGEAANAPAAYVRALDLQVGRLEQSYRRMPQTLQPSESLTFAYSAPEFDVAVVLRCDASGLTVDYPDLARRI